MSTIDDAFQRFCKERFPVPTEARVAELEDRLGVPLPADYRRFLLAYNGGFFSEPDIVPPTEGCPHDRLTFLCGIGAAHPTEDLAAEDLLGLFDNNDPAQIVPIGYTLMGNLILLITHPEDHGTIALKKAFSDETFFLASGIEEFFGLLQEPSDD